MKAVVLDAYGSAENLTLRDVSTPNPSAQEIRIRIKAAGFNPVDYKIRLGAYGDGKKDLPKILGSDCSGVVDAVGTGVKDFKIGDEVYAMTFGQGSGCYAEFLCLHADMVCKKPSNISFEAAASVPLASMTAYRAINAVSSVKKGDKVFIAGAGGGVGSFAVQLAKLSGADAILTVAANEKSALALQNELGFKKDEILFYTGKTTEELKESLSRMNQGQLFNTTLDFVGKDTKKLCLLLTGNSGHFVTILPESHEFNLPVWGGRESICFNRNLSLHFVYVGSEATSGDSGKFVIYKQNLQAISDLIEKGSLKVPNINIVGDLSVETVREAHRLLEEGHVKGKLVMRVP